LLADNLRAFCLRYPARQLNSTREFGAMFDLDDYRRCDAPAFLLNDLGLTSTTFMANFPIGPAPNLASNLR
jgi:hypothetical protein